MKITPRNRKTPIIDLLKHEPTTLDDVPQRDLFRMAFKLYTLGALAWDYASTVLDISAQMRISELKKLSRAIREIKLDYDRMRQRDLDSDHIRKEWELAELFESINSDNFRTLTQGLRNEIYNVNSELKEDYVLLVEAVQIAMTVLDTMKLFASQCDKLIQNYYTASHSILPDHFRKLSILLPEYAGDCYDNRSPSRQLASKKLLDEINKIELYDENDELV